MIWARDARREDAGGDLGALGHDRAGGDHRARPDLRVLQDDRAHPDQGAVADRAPLEQRAVADDHVGADHGRQIVGAVDDRGVLDRAAGTDLDVRDVAAQHGAEPDVAPVADADVADQDGGRGQEHALADRRRDAVELNDRGHLTSLSRDYTIAGVSQVSHMSSTEELAPWTEEQVRQHLAAGKLVEGLQHMSPTYLEGMRRILTVSADTEFVSAPAYLRAAQHAPALNNFGSAMSIIQDELAHAHIGYRLLGDLGRRHGRARV